jgi:hypothetical protein
LAKLWALAGLRSAALRWRSFCSSSGLSLKVMAMQGRAGSTAVSGLFAADALLD